MRRRIKTFYKLGRIFTQYFLYKATSELLKTLFKKKNGSAKCHVNHLSYDFSLFS